MFILGWVYLQNSNEKFTIDLRDIILVPISDARDIQVLPNEANS
jgi:hypothetical protein